MVKKIMCRNCEKYIPADSTYCPKCSVKIKTGQEIKEQYDTTALLEKSETIPLSENFTVNSNIEHKINTTNISNNNEESKKLLSESKPTMQHIDTTPDVMIKKVAIQEEGSCNIPQIVSSINIDMEKEISKDKITTEHKNVVHKDENVLEVIQDDAISLKDNNKKSSIDADALLQSIHQKNTTGNNVMINGVEILDSPEGLTKEMIIHSVSVIVGIFALIVILVFILK